ncbi:unnamed protein product [Withania somnifera]
MSCVTPYAFVQFFLSRFNREISEFIRTGTDEIIMSVLRDVSLMNHRPSIIAAAATLFEGHRNLTRQELEIKINVLPLNGFLNIDNVWSCCYGLLELNYLHI